jgi:integrase
MSAKIEKRGKGYSFVVTVSYDPATGKRVRKRHSGYRSRKDAERARAEIETQLHTGMYVHPSKLTVGQFLQDQWLPTIASTVKPSTHVSYTNLVAAAMPYIGAVPLQALTAGHLNAMYAKLGASGGRARNAAGVGVGRPLAPRTVAYIHAVIRKALNDAMKWSLLVRNPALSADPPKQSTSKDIEAWDGPQLARFLDSVADERLAAAWRLSAMTGARRGEVLGLRWQDVDLDGGRLWITQVLSSVSHRLEFGAPKTANGRREIALDAGTVLSLLAHRAAQAEERQRYGPQYDRRTDLVFRREDGSPVHPDQYSRWFNAHVSALGLKRISLHGLRHTHATLALKAGVPIHVVSKRLGHSGIAVTLQYYSFVLPGMDQSAADSVAAIVFAPEEVMPPNSHHFAPLPLLAGGVSA